MINIQIYKTNSIYKLEVKGHAGAGKYGEDVICAAISTLTYTFLASVDEILTIDSEDYFYEIGKDAHISFEIDLNKLSKEQKNEFFLLVKFFEIGLKGSIEGNEDFVKMTPGRCRHD